MIFCGIDIEENMRFTKYFEGDEVFVKLVKDVFSEREIELNNKTSFPNSFTAGFTCKEAIFKVLGVSWMNSDIQWQDIELIFNGNKITDYKIILSGYAELLMNKKNIREIQSEILELENHVLFKVIMEGSAGSGIDFC